jgi:dolichol kinase
MIFIKEKSFNNIMKMTIRSKKIAHHILKTLLFLALFLLSVRYVHTYPVPLTRKQTDLLVTLSEKAGWKDPELFYIAVMSIIDLIAATLAYVAIIKLWRYYRTSRSARQASSK